MQTTKFDYLVIVASGLGTRMQQYTLNNYLSKSLVSLGNETILDAQLKDAADIATKVIIICRSQHVHMYRDICKLKKYNVHDFVCYNNADGTLNTIKHLQETLIDDWHNKSALFVWSDILCKHKNSNTLKPLIKLNTFNANKQLQVTIGLDDNKIHRFLYNANAISKVDNSKGNIVGVYATNNLELLFKAMHKVNLTNADFVEFVKESAKQKELHVTPIKGISFIDVGDSDKYVKFMSTVSIKQRYFNDLQIHDDRVVKSSNCDKGFDVMQNEIDHYLFCKHAHKTNIFADLQYYKIDESTKTASLTIERLDKTMHELLENGGNPYQVYKSFVQSMQQLHAIKSDMHTMHTCNSAILEYVHITDDRFNSIKHILKYNDNVHYIYDSIMSRLYKYLSSKTFEFSLIHGDTNTANVMINSNGDIKLIDPRGYFGNVKHYGDANYDLAKFAYGITGYTHFNNDTNFTAKFNNNELSYDIETFADLDRLVGDDYIKLLVGVIWLKLPAYIINNPLKSICAFDIGLRLTDKYLTNLGY
jgi:NDP-sugar pyrophosphorylase family protein